MRRRQVCLREPIRSCVRASVLRRRLGRACSDAAARRRVAAPFGKLPHANATLLRTQRRGFARWKERGRASGVHDGFCYRQQGTKRAKLRAENHRFSARPSPMRRSTCELHFLTRARPKLCEGPPHIFLRPIAYVYIFSYGQFTRRRWRLGNHRISC